MGQYLAEHEEEVEASFRIIYGTINPRDRESVFVSHSARKNVLATKVESISTLGTETFYIAILYFIFVTLYLAKIITRAIKKWSK